MRVLVTGRCIPQQPDRCTGQQLAHGFREAGHECVFYGNFYGQPFSFLGVKEAQGQDFDLVVVTEMNDGMPGYDALFQYHRLRDVPRLYWDFDVSYHHEVSYARASAIEYDGYLVGNRLFCGPDGFGRFRKPVLHLPYACSPKIHKRLPEIERNYTLGFVGSLTDERARLLEVAQSAAYNRADVHISDGVFGDDLVRQTNKYRVMFHNNQDACKGLVPGRPWETTACGTTLLMDRTSYDDFVAFLPSDLHEYLYVYDNESDIRRFIALQTGADRKHAILDLESETLMRYVHKNHSYQNRAERIIEWSTEQKILTPSSH